LLNEWFVFKLVLSEYVSIESELKLTSDDEDEDVAMENSMFCLLSWICGAGLLTIVLELFLFVEADFRLKNLDAIKSNVLLEDDDEFVLAVVVGVVAVLFEVGEILTDCECVWLDFKLFVFVFELGHVVVFELFSGVFNVDDFLLPNRLFEKKNEVILPLELAFDEDFFVGVSTW